MPDDPEWAEFEEYLYPSIRKRYPAKEGWTIEQQKFLKSGRRIDYVAYNGSKRVVIEAKDKKTLERKDVEQILRYRNEYKAQLGILCVASDTEISASLKELCKKKGIKISRTKWRK